MPRIAQYRTSNNQSELLGEAETREESSALTKMVLVEDEVVMGKPRTLLMNPNINIYQPLLTREYLITTRSVNISGVRETRNSYEVVQLLRRQVAIQKVLSLYNWYRFSGVKVRILTRSLPQQYGFAWLTRCAYYDTTQTNLSGNDLWISKDPVVLILNEQSAATIELPNVSMRNWFLTQDKTGGTTTNDGEDLMWSVNISNEATYLTDASVSTTYEIYMFASFINPEVAGPVDPNYVPPPMKSKDKIEKARGQSEKPTWAHVAGGIAMGTTAVFGATRNANLYNMTTDIAEEEICEEKAPMDSQPIQNNPWGDLSRPAMSGSGVNLDMMPPICRIQPGSFGDPEKRHSVKSLIERPQLELVSFLTATSEPITLEPIPSSFLVTGGQQSIGYLAWMTQFFRRWRGSLKVLMMFTTSSFVSARVFVRVAWGRGLASTSLGDFHTDVITIKGNVNHTLVLPYLYPEPWQFTSEPPDVSTRPMLQISLDSISSTGDQTPGVVMMLWIAAGDDFVFDSYQYASTSGSAPMEVAKGQTDVTALFKNTSFDTVTGFAPANASQFSVTIEDLLSRWSSRYGVSFESSSARVYAFTSVTPIPAFIQNWDFLCNMFLYNSGSVRRKYSWTVLAGVPPPGGFIGYATLPSTNPYGFYSIDDYNTSDGLAMTNLELCSVLDVAIPYIANFEVDLNPEWAYTIGFGSTIEFSVEVGHHTATTTQDNLSFIKGGPDFMLHFLQPLPDRTLWMWSIPPSLRFKDAKKK
jgi:hypothetical protein